MQVETHQLGGLVPGARRTLMYLEFTITLVYKAARCFRTYLIFELAKRRVQHHYGWILLA